MLEKGRQKEGERRRVRADTKSPIKTIFENGPAYLPEKPCCELSFQDDIVFIRPIETQGKYKGQSIGPSLTLKVDQIVSADVITTPQRYIENESVIGRAAAVGALFFVGIQIA